MFDRPVIRQFIRYFGAALAGYLIDVATLIFLTEVLLVHYLISATIGFVLALVVVYLLSNRFVFGESKIKSGTKQFVVFGLIGLVGLIILNILMWALTSGLQINYVVSKLIATIVVYMWNFFARRSLYRN